MPHAAISNGRRQPDPSKVGVLAVQGDFAEHIAVLKRLYTDTVEVRLPRDLEGVEALIIPGGESTTLDHLMSLYGLKDSIKAIANAGVPIWGTCAGMILMASRLNDSRFSPLGLMDITVARNAFGRQIDSFEEDLDIPAIGSEKFRAVFIRAPIITEVGREADVLARLCDGTPAAVRQENILATAFHPELTDDMRFHEYFLDLIREDNRIVKHR